MNVESYEIADISPFLTYKWQSNYSIVTHKWNEKPEKKVCRYLQLLCKNLYMYKRLQFDVRQIE